MTDRERSLGSNLAEKLKAITGDIAEYSHGSAVLSATAVVAIIEQVRATVQDEEDYIKWVRVYLFGETYH